MSQTATKEMKFQDDMTIKVFENTADNDNTKEYILYDDKTCRSLARIVTDGDKLKECSGTEDVQNSGLMEKFAKKVGVKADDVIYTLASQKVKRGDEDAEKPDDGKAEKLKKSFQKLAKSAQDLRIKQIKDAHKDKDPKAEFAQKVQKYRDSNKEPDTSSDALEQKVKQRYGLQKSYIKPNKPATDTKGPNVIDYAKMNKIKTAPPAKSLDYQTHEKPVKEQSKWKQDKATDDYIKDRTMISTPKAKPLQKAAGATGMAAMSKLCKNMVAGYGNAPGTMPSEGMPPVAPMGKSEPLQKDVVKFEKPKKNVKPQLNNEQKYEQAAGLQTTTRNDNVKAKDFSKKTTLTPETEHWALNELNNNGHHDIVDQYKAGKIDARQAADMAEDRNFHGPAAAFRSQAGDDIPTLVHAEKAHNDFDLNGRPEKYADERDGALRAKYFSNKSSRDLHDRLFKPNSQFNDHSGPIDALLYMHNNGLENTATANELKTHISKNRPAYSKVINGHIDHAQKQQQTYLQGPKDEHDAAYEQRNPGFHKKVASEYGARAQLLTKLHNDLGMNQPEMPKSSLKVVKSQTPPIDKLQKDVVDFKGKKGSQDQNNSQSKDKRTTRSQQLFDLDKNVRQSKDKHMTISELRQRMQQKSKLDSRSQKDKIQAALDKQPNNPYAERRSDKGITQPGAGFASRDKQGNKNPKFQSAVEAQTNGRDNSRSQSRNSEHGLSAADKLAERAKDAQRRIEDNQLNDQIDQKYADVHGAETLEAKNGKPDNVVNSIRVPGSNRKVDYYGKDEKGNHHFQSEQTHAIVTPNGEFKQLPTKPHEWHLNDAGHYQSSLGRERGHKAAMAGIRKHPAFAEATGKKTKQSNVHPDFDPRDHKILENKNYRNGYNNIRVDQTHGANGYKDQNRGKYEFMHDPVTKKMSPKSAGHNSEHLDAHKMAFEHIVKPKYPSAQYDDSAQRAEHEPKLKVVKSMDGALQKSVPSGVNPKKFEDCVHDVKKQGKDIGSAHAICTSSLKKCMSIMKKSKAWQMC